MPEKVRVSPAPPSVIHRANQAALVELEELPVLDEEEVEEEDDESEDFGADLVSDDEDEDEEDDSALAGTELLPLERLSVR
jgi:hypothetical protein